MRVGPYWIFGQGEPMKTLWLLATVATAALVLFTDGSASNNGEKHEEPNYNGKPLSHWLAALQDPSVRVRVEAAEALGQLEPETKAPVPALRAALKDVEVLVRRRAAESLFQIDCRLASEVQDVFRADLKDPDLEERRAAAAMLGRLGPVARKAIRDLHEALKDADRLVRIEAATALANIDPRQAPDGLPTLVDALNDAPQEIGLPAPVLALRKIGRFRGDTISSLVTPLKQSGKESRIQLAIILGLIGPPAKDAVPALRDALRDPDSTIRLCAAQAIGLIDPAQAKNAIPIAVAILKDPDYESRRTALFLLSELGPQAKEAVPALLTTTKSAPKDAQEADSSYLFDALGEIGSASKETVPALVGMLNDETKSFEAAYTLGLIGVAAKAAAAAITAKLKNRKLATTDQLDELTAFFYAQALVRIDTEHSETAIPSLVQTLGQKDAGDMVEPSIGAAEALAEIGPSAKQAARALVSALKSWDFLARPFAMKALMRIDPIQARTFVPTLMTGLKDRNPDERRCAAKSLAMMGPDAKEAIPALIDKLNDPDVRVDAADALGRIGPAARQAVPALIAPLKDQVALGRRRAATLSQETTRKSHINSALRDEQAIERLTILKAFHELKMPIPLGHLFDLVTDADRLMCRHVCEALGGLGDAAKDAIPALVAAREDPDALIRLAAACALVRIDPGQAKDVIPALVAALKDPEWGVRTGAATARGTIGPPARESFSSLLPLLKDPVRLVRKETTRALRQIDPETARKLGVPPVTRVF
jgi:HEAT repeat protein